MKHIIKFLQRRPALATLIAFVATISISRLTVIAIENHFDIPFLGYNIVGDYHIHHFAYGIIIISVIALYSLFINYNQGRKFLFPAYGIALGLIYDEFGIWIKLDPTYNQTLSTIAIISITLILATSAVFEQKYPGLWK